MGETCTRNRLWPRVAEQDMKRALRHSGLHMHRDAQARGVVRVLRVAWCSDERTRMPWRKVRRSTLSCTLGREVKHAVLHARPC